VTLSVAIAVSLAISLTTTPMMCARLLRPLARDSGRKPRLFDRVIRGYERSLQWVLRHQPLMLAVTLATMVATVFLYAHSPEGVLPAAGLGRPDGTIQADQDTSFQAMQQKLQRFVDTCSSDPDGRERERVLSGRSTNNGRMFVLLEAEGDRKLTADQIIARLRGKLAHVPGATLVLQPVQDVRTGGRASAAQYQYTLAERRRGGVLRWAPRLLQKLRASASSSDVNSDQQNRGLQASLEIDRATASRLGSRRRRSTTRSTTRSASGRSRRRTRR
jgi:multidrug efflux pump